MICRFSAENYKTFGNKIELDFFANMNIKRLDCNYNLVENKNILKTVGFYGPNNTGKTCSLLAIMDLRALMLNEAHLSFNNVFANKGDVTKFSVEYEIDGRFYVYDVEYDNKNRLYLKESLALKDYKNASSSLSNIFKRSENRLTWFDSFIDFKKTNVAQLFSSSLPFMLASDIRDNEVLVQAKNDYIKFAKSLRLLRMDRPIDISKTIDLMQRDKKAASFIKEFVRNCDLHIDDFGFDDNVVSDTNIEQELSLAMNDPRFVKEYLKIYSMHNGYRVPSVFFDSIGTQKLVALSGYIYDAIVNGGVLLIDEIDSSLHHILTKSIVAMFNNVLNTKAQLLFTTHDVLLMDLKNLFRKDQIWLVDIVDGSTSTIKRLSDGFTSRSENGIRGNEDITNYYIKGRFGAIPTPDLFSSLEEATSRE